LKVEERYWMLRGVLAMDILKPVARWICLARARKGMRWPCAINGSITICSIDLDAINNFVEVCAQTEFGSRTGSTLRWEKSAGLLTKDR
jgi:hypothetical protein